MCSESELYLPDRHLERYAQKLTVFNYHELTPRAVVLSLSKVVKDILIIFASAIALGTPITPLQWVG